MNILAIYFDSGSGINVIYERLISNLTQYANVDILRDFLPDQKEEIPNIRGRYYRPYTKKMQSWYRKCVRWFGTTPISNRWARKVSEEVAKDYDLVLAFCTSAQLTPAVCGKHISQMLGCKFGIYAVDAIPGPNGWTRKRGEFSGKMRIIKELYPCADYVASANKHMLEYQLQTFKHKPNLQTSVLYTSSPEAYYTYPISDQNIFLYTGNIYGLRNPDYFLGAFKRILGLYPDAKLILVGMKFKLKHLSHILTGDELKRVEILPHTDNLGELFAKAKVLLDIDGDVEKDPFLSSKIATYLKVNRMIVCETGQDTPSRELFGGLNTIIQCDHNTESMYNGMLKALEMAGQQQDFSERDSLIEIFSAESVSRVLWRDITKLCR